MELVLVRHGEPEWVRDGLNVDDPPLTERGHRQAEAMAVELAKEPFDEVLCSPLTRARQTAAPLLARLDKAEVVDEWLEEIRNPLWHGTPAEKAEEAFKEERRRVAEDRWRGLDELGGEPVRDFVERMRLGCQLFLSEHGVERVPGELPVWQIESPEQRIALVAHAGTNSVVICHLLGLSPTPWEWERFVLRHASISRLQSLPLGDGFTFSLTRLSGDEHLSVDDRTV
jgi:probable phosphoglycerate mutase